MQKSPALPIRATHNRATASTPRSWHNRNRALLERILAGLRAVEWPAPCRSTVALRSYAHAHQVMAVHSGHRCPRYRMAADYAMEVRP